MVVTHGNRGQESVFLEVVGRKLNWKVGFQGKDKCFFVSSLGHSHSPCGLCVYFSRGFFPMVPSFRRNIHNGRTKFKYVDETVANQGLHYETQQVDREAHGLPGSSESLSTSLVTLSGQFRVKTSCLQYSSEYSSWTLSSRLSLESTGRKPTLQPLMLFKS